MNKNIIIVAVVLALVGGYFLLYGGSKTPQEPGAGTQSGVPAPGQESVPERIVSPDGSKDETEPSATTINVVSGNLFFDPESLTFTKDQPVRITFSNTGVHTFTVDALGINEPIRGNSATIEFTPTQSGTFEFYCAVPGHRGAGMFGSLTVE